MGSNVRVGTASRVHRVYNPKDSGILARALIPACGVSAGRPVPRTATTEPVTCPSCLKASH